MWSLTKRIFSCTCNWGRQHEDEANIVDYQDISIYEATHYPETKDRIKEKKYECNINRKGKNKSDDGFREIFGNFNAKCQKYG